MDDEGDLTALLPSEVLSVTQNAKACDVGGCVCIECVHQSCRWTQRHNRRKESVNMDVRDCTQDMNAGFCKCTSLTCSVESGHVQHSLLIGKLHILLCHY